MNKLVTFGEIMLRLSPPGHQRFAQATSLEVVYGGGKQNLAILLVRKCRKYPCKKLLSFLNPANW